MTKATENRLEKLLRKYRQRVFDSNGDQYSEKILQVKQLLMPVWKARLDSQEPRHGYCDTMWM